jgi:hypothetical protein
MRISPVTVTATAAQLAAKPQNESKKPKAKVQTVAGHRLPEPRITPMAIWLAFLWVGLPVLAIGGALDLVSQLVFGVCTGLWCLPAPPA